VSFLAYDVTIQYGRGDYLGALKKKYTNLIARYTANTNLFFFFTTYWNWSIASNVFLSWAFNDKSKSLCKKQIINCQKVQLFIIDIRQE